MFLSPRLKLNISRRKARMLRIQTSIAAQVAELHHIFSPIFRVLEGPVEILWRQQAPRVSFHVTFIPASKSRPNHWPGTFKKDKFFLVSYRFPSISQVQNIFTALQELHILAKNLLGRRCENVTQLSERGLHL